MALLPPSSDLTGASVTEGGFKAALTTLRVFLNDLLGADSANKVAARAALGVALNGTVAKSAAYTAVAADCGKVINCTTGTFTITLTSALALGDGWNVSVANTGTGEITINTSLSQLIDGAASVKVPAGSSKLVYCTGTQFATVGGGGGDGSPVGATMDFVGSSAPNGWVMASGRTIGNASSGATERANADCYNLFVLLWQSMANAQAPVVGGRGASADADWSANKAITLPDARGRVVAGKDNMGGATASRLTSAGSGIDGTTLGAAGGTQTHTLTAVQSGLPSHSHTYSSPIGVSAGYGSGAYISMASATTGAAGGTSASQAHQNTQPTLVLNKIIKL